MANSPFIYGPNGATSLVPGGVNLPGSTSGTLQIQPAASTTSYAVTMPAAQGTGALTNNGSGVLSWTPSGSGTAVNASIGMTTQYTPSGGSPIQYDTVIFDTNSAYNTGTGVYTVPVTGRYQVSVVANCTTGTASMYVNKSGTDFSFLCTFGLSGTDRESGSVLVDCTLGDTLSIKCDSTHPLQGHNGVIGGYENILNIFKIN